VSYSIIIVILDYFYKLQRDVFPFLRILCSPFTEQLHIEAFNYVYTLPEAPLIEKKEAKQTFNGEN
jgi:hypothetical protein